MKVFKKKVELMFEIDIEVEDKYLDQVPTNEEAAAAFLEGIGEELDTAVQTLVSSHCVVTDREE